MRTAIILAAGLLVFAGLFVYARLFVNYYPSALTVATYGFVAFWLAATSFNLWVGVYQAGYSMREELLIMSVLFAIPAAVALATKWKFS